jgi:hypothetical protein
MLSSCYLCYPLLFQKGFQQLYCEVIKLFDKGAFEETWKIYYWGYLKLVIAVYTYKNCTYISLNTNYLNKHLRT